MTAEPEILDSVDTPIGLFYLARHKRPSHPGEWIYCVHVEGALLMSSVSPLSERQLATSALALHGGGDGLRVLIGGLGLGYTAQAALESSRPSAVRVVDRMDFVVRWLKEGLLPLSEQLNADERLELVLGDVYADLLGPATETWDIILVDVDHSPDETLDPTSEAFYTLEGQARVARHLAPGGVLAVWSAHDNHPFATVMDQSYPVASREHVCWPEDVEGEEKDDLHNVLFFGRNQGTRTPGSEPKTRQASATPGVRNDHDAMLCRDVRARRSTG